MVLCGYLSEKLSELLFEVSHWFDPCDLHSFERSGSRVLLGWLDEPTQGELHVGSLSEPDAFLVEWPVARRLRPRTAESPVGTHSSSARADLARASPAAGVSDH